MENSCQLFGPFGLFVQGLLGLIILSSLFVKHLHETPRRTWKVFWLDTSKQGFSASLAHLMNLAIAKVLSEWESDDECVWYFLNIVIDCSLGVYIAYLILQCVEAFAVQRCAILRTGHYYTSENTIDISAWLLQLVVWCLIVSAAKWILVCVIALLRPMLKAVGHILLAPIEGFPRLELMFVMVAVPCVMNCFQFWVQDGFLKAEDKPEMEKPLLEMHCDNMG